MITSIPTATKYLRSGDARIEGRMYDAVTHDTYAIITRLDLYDGS